MSSPVELFKVSPDHIARTFPQIGHFVRKATERGRGKQGPTDLFDAMREGRMQLWVLAAPGEHVGIVITEVSEYPRKKICRVVACVGEGRERWQHHLTGIEDWARQIGCDGMELIARKGWARVVEDYELTHVILERDL